MIYSQEKILRFDMNIYDFVVKCIYELCEERNITPNALSYLAGISQSTVKSILNGEAKSGNSYLEKDMRRFGYYPFGIF